jgi:hypothetical protein
MEHDVDATDGVTICITSIPLVFLGEESIEKDKVVGHGGQFDPPPLGWWFIYESKKPVQNDGCVR